MSDKQKPHWPVREPDQELMARLWEAIHDPSVREIRLTLMDRPGRGEEVCYQAMLHPKDPFVGSCHSLLRTPSATLRHLLDGWNRKRRGQTVTGAALDDPEIADMLG